MNRRLAIYELRSAFGLAPEQGQALEDLARLGGEPPALATWLARTLVVLGGGLLGLGVILWVAANWPDLGRASKFALLEGLVVLSVAGAIWRPAARSGLLLLAFLAQGGVLAFFGQTYQTGADPWQLFALWAALGLPLAAAAHSGALWLPFSLVVMTAISLWVQAHAGYRWGFSPEAASVHYVGWLLAAGVAVVFSPLPALQRRLNAGAWTYRASLLLALGQLCPTSLMALFDSDSGPHYGAGLLIATLYAVCVSRRRVFDVFALCLAGLTLDVLVIGGLAWLIMDAHSNAILSFLVLGLFSAIIVAATAAALRQLVRRHEQRLQTETQP